MILHRFAATLATAAVACGITHARPNPAVLEIGAAMPPFELPGIDGKTYSQADFADARVLAILFTCNHCPASVAASDRIEAIHQDFKDKGVALVAVNPNHPGSLRPDELGYSPYNDSFEEMAPFAADLKWTFPYLYDGETQEFARACGAQATPHVFVFDADRKLRYTGRMDDGGRARGPVEKSYIRDAIEAVLAGREVAEPTTRALGCSTKWQHLAESVAAEQKRWEALPVTLEDLDEELAKKLRKNESGNIRFINFWSTTCGACIVEFPDLVETYRRFQNRTVDFISISLDPADRRAAAHKFLESLHAALSPRTAPSLEKDGRTSNNYIWAGGNPDTLAEAIDPEWTGAMPHTIVVAPGGEILWRFTGKVDPFELRRQLLRGLDAQ
ncbi:MAG: redoxin family protein [Luteolibacter sp.]